MVNKAKQAFSNLGDKIRTSVRIKPEAPFLYLSLVLIIVIAILVRISAAINGNFLIKEFDPWAQFSAVQYIVKNGWYDFLHWHDFKMWAPEGADRFGMHPGTLFVSSALYLLLQDLGIPVTLFEVAFYFPAVFGAVTVFVMYLFGKEVLDERAGLICAFFLALSPGHMQRTTAGFFDNENIGVVTLLLCLLFFVKGCKSGKPVHGFLSGFFIGILSLTGGGMAYPFLLLPLLTGVLILADRYDTKVFTTFTTSITTGLLIFSFQPVFTWEMRFTTMETMIPIIFIPIIVAYQFIYMQKGKKIYEQVITAIKWAIVPAAITFLIIYWQKPEWIPFDLGSRLGSIINPAIRDSQNLVASVGEHMPSPWSVFYSNTLIALLLIIPGFYFALKRMKKEDILMIVVCLTLLYFTGSMVRIILVLASAISLIGGYALANIMKYFGNLMKSQQFITRRRKRQLKHTVGKAEGMVVYAFIGFLLFVQANHAINVAVTELGYAELIPGGVFHDWEETLTFMKNNLPGTSVVVSWWDYGYWITIIGNQTSVNDNATWNSTRIGLTGMAMMSPDERYSAEIFRQLKADYVLVYFGHLYSGLGGDEGKWPWMLRICNDNTENYRSMGLERKDIWYGDNDQVKTVWDEAEFINNTSGLYEEKWFDSQVVKLMFYGAPTKLSEVTSYIQTEAYFASQIEGNTEQSITARTDDNGHKWSEHIPDNGKYNFQYFQPYFFSSNRLCKIYKVDYGALDASFNYDQTYLDETGLGYVKMTNKGTMDMTPRALIVNQVEYNMSVQYPNNPIKPNEARYIWFNTGEKGKYWDATDTYTIDMYVEIEQDDGTKSYISNTSISKQIEATQSAKIAIDRSASKMEIQDDGSALGYVTVKNTGNRLVSISNVSVNGDMLNMSAETLPIDNVNYAGNFLIAPGQSEYFRLHSSAISPPELNWDANITFFTLEGVSDETSIAFSKKNAKLTILSPELEIMPENNFLTNYNQTYNPTTPPIGRFYQKYNPDSTIDVNGNLVLKVRNDGNEMIGLQKLYVDDQALTFTVDGDDPFPLPGETRIVRATVSNIEVNKPVKVFIVGEYGETTGMTASDGLYLVPYNSTASVSIISNNQSMTTGFANETVKLVVKNTGLVDITLSQIVVNTTSSVNLQAGNVSTGSLTLKPSQTAVVMAAFTGLKVNNTNTLDVTIKTTNGNVYDTKTITARMPTYSSLINIYDDSDNYPDNAQYLISYAHTDNMVNLMIRTTFLNQTLTVDGVYVRKSDGNYTYLGLGFTTLKDNKSPQNTITSYEMDGTTDNLYALPLYYLSFNINTAAGMSLIAGETLYVKVITTFGYEAEVELTVT